MRTQVPHGQRGAGIPGHRHHPICADRLRVDQRAYASLHKRVACQQVHKAHRVGGPLPPLASGEDRQVHQQASLLSVAVALCVGSLQGTTIVLGVTCVLQVTLLLLRCYCCCF